LQMMASNMSDNCFTIFTRPIVLFSKTITPVCIFFFMAVYIISLKLWDVKSIVTFYGISI
jgi:hypothetical protein